MESRLNKLEMNEGGFPPVYDRQNIDLIIFFTSSSTTRSLLSCSRYSREAVLSNQDLYELVQDAHNWTLHFSTLKQAVSSLVKMLEEDYDRVIQKYETDKGKWRSTGAVGVGVLTAVAVFFWWNPAGWAALGVVGVGAAAGGAVGGAAGVGAHAVWDAEGGKAFGKKSTVRDCKIFPTFHCSCPVTLRKLSCAESYMSVFTNTSPLHSFCATIAKLTTLVLVKRAIKALEKSANEAREAIAMVFCAQVMKKRLDETLPEHHKRTILATLGIDVDATSSPVYNAELVIDRLRPFRENNRTVRDSLEMVTKDSNFEFQTTERAE